ncbi:nuclear transport factor 2 family protein [Streptomyces sp. PTM05]|uniref:Nuclear transport factor 2 family protein n=1 Tax=Streptantibioticus parmotrematis TaxID=2873249 RepID=A0ABS7QRE9_9ACTN|nr:nuclear transport factor 2 family protein [Streptantibioticus parmotrematis]MBY8885761.1 nuclear transport factor 2 family protein [Streptantibioticus parmotrematis]
MTSSSTLPTSLAAALDSLKDGDVDGWLDLFAPDGVHEFPWAPKGWVSRLEGHDAMRAYMGGLGDNIVFGHLDDIHVYESGADTVVQATGHHHRPDGTPRDLHYIWFLTRRDDGKVTRFQDYMNPEELSAL